MTDMSKYNSPEVENNDLKADAEESRGKVFKLTIKEVGEHTYPPGKYSDVPVTKSTLFFEETDKRLVVRPQANRHLCEKYTSDSTAWVGKQVSIEADAWQSDTGSGWMWTITALDVEFDDKIPF